MKRSLTVVFPIAFLVFTAYVWMVTVVLSLFHQLTPLLMMIATGVGLVLAIGLWRRLHLSLVIPRSRIALIVGLLFALTFVQGVVSAPNTTDSMIYHLPRVMYWMQSKTIFLDHTVTSHDYMPPLSESIVMYFMLLTGSDRLAFLPQWLAGICVISVTSLIATQLRLSQSSRRIALLLVATIPIVLLQSVSTQTDLMMTAFLSLSVYFAMRKQLWPLALSVALGFIAKQLFVVYAIIPLGLLLPDLWTLVQKKLMTVIGGSLLFAVCIAPYLLSNIHLYGTLMGSQVTGSGQTLILTNERMDLGLLASNIVRNMLLQLPFPFFSHVIESHVGNDPSTTWYGSTFVMPRVFIPQEDIASAPIQVILILSAFIVSLHSPIDKLQRRIVIFSLLSFILFCLFLKWQPFNPRLHLAWIAIGTPVAVAILARYQRTLKSLAVLSILLAFVTILANTSHPFFSYDVIFARLQNFAPAGQLPPQSIFTQSREKQYFAARPYWYEPYANIMQDLQQKNVQSVSLSLFDEFTYPMMVRLNQQHISVDENSTHQVISDKAVSGDVCYSTSIPYGEICIK